MENDLFPETLLVSRQGERVFTTSLKIAEHFGKQHKHVLRDIKSLLADIIVDEVSRSNFGPRDEVAGDLGESNFGLTAAAGSDFSRLNFEPRDYVDERGKSQPMYLLSHDSFALLAMGFTGKAALRWKIAFLAAFREMERQLAAMKEREANALYAIRPRWKPIAAHPELSRSQLTALTGHRSLGSITACRRRMRDVGLI